MLNISLSRRLRAAADCVPDGCRAADIGCDHGKLSAYLVTEKGCTVTAADLRPDPLAKAQELFVKLGISDRARAVLSDGFDAVEPDIDTAVIAGIGADNIIRILERCQYIKSGIRLILVPASRHSLQRRYLAGAGFVTVDETPICESGHCYTVIEAIYGGAPREISGGEAAVGLIAQKSGPDAERYIKAALNRAERALGGLNGAKDTDAYKLRELNETIIYLRGLIYDHT